MRLNIGCGNKPREGFLGVDRFRTDATGLVCDVDAGLPFRADSVDAVHLDNVVEHVSDVLGFMKEIHRICRDGAAVTMITPHFTSWDSWRDPTHRNHFSYFTVDHFESSWISDYADCRFEVEKRHLSFSGGLFGLVGRLLFTLNPRWWERKLCFVFRGGTLYFTLKVRKQR